MFNKRISIVILLVLPFLASAQKQDTIPLPQILEEVQITGVNAGEKTPVSFTNITEDDIEKNNLGKDLPYLVSLTPSEL